jgi:ribonuclease P protein component
VFALPEVGAKAPEFNETPGAVGIVASRKVGNSPRRSRAKRVLRAALREIQTRHVLRGHLILVARRSLIDDELRSIELEPELERLLRDVGSLEVAET